jgi:choline dehydrogenase-like flavoprotein
VSRNSADFIIVGSGIGGATAAKELSAAGKKVLILEKGKKYLPKQMGSEFLAMNFYDRKGLWSKTKEGVIFYRAFAVGGSSLISCGNGVRSLQKELADMGINLQDEFGETEEELKITPVPDKFIGRGAKAIKSAAGELGYEMKPMPKFIDFSKCVSCAGCVVGCSHASKWTAVSYIEEARKNGAELMECAEVDKIIVSGGKAAGVEAFDESGNKGIFKADKIVLSAGALSTPVILEKSGITAGHKLFFDLFTVTMGLHDDIGGANELVMSVIHHNDGFALSSFIDSPFALASSFPASLRSHFRIGMHRKNLLGLMVKIKDDSKGAVLNNGQVEKKVSAADLEKLNKGQTISRDILIKAGTDPDSIINSRIRGAHPGGTAAIGDVVDINLQTRVKGLFVCDASVLPQAPGLPPIVTIIAMAKKFSKSFKG